MPEDEYFTNYVAALKDLPLENILQERGRLEKYKDNILPERYNRAMSLVDAELDTKDYQRLNSDVNKSLGETLTDDNLVGTRRQLSSLGQQLFGQNRPAYAGADGGMTPNPQSSIGSELYNGFSIKKGAAPDGSDLVKIDNSVFDGVPNNTKSKAKALKDYLKGLRGNDMPLNYGEDGSAKITNRGINEVSRTGTINTRGRLAGNLDEILEVSKVNPNEPIKPDVKNRQFAKDGFEYRESYVDVDGDIYKVRSNIALNDGAKTFHTLNRYNDTENTPVQLGESSAGSSGGASDRSIPYGDQNVNMQDDPFLAYGESDLATGRVTKQNLLSKVGRAMEAAQVNATRKETRDIGIGNSGELVNRLRKRTGYSNIEDQAAFGRELTGGENSLLDSIQRNAIGATENGGSRVVDIEKVMPQINKLIDDAPNTLVSPKQKDSIREAIMADLTNPGIDTIHKANNFKSAAKQQFLINDRTPNDSAKELGKLYTKVAALVDDVSYAEIPKTQVEAMFETGAREARARAQVASKNGNERVATAYNNLADELESSPKTVQAYRSIKKDYVDINKLSRKTQQGATAWNNPLTMGSAITAAMMTGSPLTAIPAAWAAKTFSPAIGEAAINTSANLGGKLADFGDALTARRSGDRGATGLFNRLVASYSPLTIKIVV